MKKPGEKAWVGLPFPYRLGKIPGPWLPTLLFFPVAVGLIGLGFWKNDQKIYPLFSWVALGLFFWTLLEYLFHRLGHAAYRACKDGAWRPWAEGIHWVHHVHPGDFRHFTTHPIPVLILAGGFFLFFRAILGDWSRALWVEGGTLLGYLSYEWVHFRAHWAHAGTPWGKFLRQYHLHHHHSREEVCFGVTTPLWDWVFRPIFGRPGSHGA